MMVRRILVYIAVVCSAVFTVAAEPFRLPVSAEPDSSAPTSGGWTSSGTMRVAVDLARRQLAVKLAASGWRHRHTIPLGGDRTVESWTRGKNELTLMTWRIAAGRTGYSFGITRQTRGDRRQSDALNRKGVSDDGG
jgi:hypothetical protein